MIHKEEPYVCINEWLFIRVNPIDNQSLFEFWDGAHSLSEAKELYDFWKELLAPPKKRSGKGLNED